MNQNYFQAGSGNMGTEKRQDGENTKKTRFTDNKEKYLYRRQYLLGPRSPEGFENWNGIRIGGNLFLHTHPDLSVTAVHDGDRSLYLLGYILDPFHPSYDDAQVMQDVVGESESADAVFENLADKCGRFVVIARFGEDVRIFSDTCGLRQVFHYTDRQGKFWCASQPHLIAGQLGIGINEVVRKDLKHSLLFHTEEYWYPGNLTLYDNIFHLTPNHYFDLGRGTVERYWPVKRLEPMTMSECLSKVQPLLSGIIEAAAHRFNLAFAISCGMDSRTLLAASRKAAENIQFITQTGKARVNDPDVQIPAALLKKLGLKHRVLMLPETLDEDFLAIFAENVATARKAKGRNAMAVFNSFQAEEREITVIYGNCSEITKRDRFRFPKTPKSLLNGAALAAMAQMGKSEIAIREFAKWLEPVKELTKYNIDILDLMHWEQRVGNWGAMALTEYEMVHESLCPYSCRRYIEYMLRVPFKYRTNPEYRLHHEIMAAMWPEVLDYEINPEDNRLKKTVEDVLYRTGLYDFIKFNYIVFYKRFK